MRVDRMLLPAVTFKPLNVFEKDAKHYVLSAAGSYETFRHWSKLNGVT